MNFLNPTHHNPSMNPFTLPAYTGEYPKDFFQIGRIASAYTWQELVETGAYKALGPTLHKNYPYKNPVWEHQLEDEKTLMPKPTSDYWFKDSTLIIDDGKIYRVEYEIFTLILIETTENPVQIIGDRNENVSLEASYELIHYPSEEICLLPDTTEQDFKYGDKIGVVKYPVSNGYDFWLVHNPSQETIDQIGYQYE